MAEQSTTLRDFGVVVAIIVVMMVIQAYQSISDTSPKKSVWENNKSMAFIQCKAFVKKRLKSPSSADFPMLDYSAEKVSEDGYLIESYVDAQNAFGAKLRNHFVCNIEWDGGESSKIENWSLVSLKLTD